jgi:hypothetical protein
MLNIATIEKRLSGLSERCSEAFVGKPMNINTAICMSMVWSCHISRIGLSGGRVLFTYQNKPSVVKNKFAVCQSLGSQTATCSKECMSRTGRKKKIVYLSL